MDEKKILVITRNDSFDNKVKRIFGEDCPIDVTDDFRSLNYRGINKKYSKVYADMESYPCELLNAYGVYLKFIEGVKYTILPDTKSLEQNMLNRTAGEFLILYSGDETMSDRIFKYYLKAALRQDDKDVLLMGETGSGKTYWANRIVSSSERKGGFFTIHCGCHPVTFESELFGYTKGAFTGASKDTPGALELFDGGTILLDDVDCLSLDEQKMLLDLLDRRRFRRLGSVLEKSCNVRFIFTTKEDILEKSAQREFRSDLLSRMAVIPIMVPSLEYHKNDIPVLIQPTLDKYQKKLTSSAYAKLYSHSWHSNIRSLLKFIELACIMSEGKDELDAADINLLYDF